MNIQQRLYTRNTLKTLELKGTNHIKFLCVMKWARDPVEATIWRRSTPRNLTIVDGVSLISYNSKCIFSLFFKRSESTYRRLIKGQIAILKFAT